ncbi:PREDICTED: uncharacterized protein LOC108358971 [Rhagoletis zephyria]|uniref:uncharacterized protein LOC108358971 n=1 Tax=Rhagoletis zephyria TaxID=28612 RepID=UPI000811561F|nr:PREDICTED: uncharacterized protein LOC108358971 [Rhagoletis zephyria]
MSLYNDDLRTLITCLVVPSVLGEMLLPQRRLQRQDLPSDISTHLADPTFDQPAKVQMLLGVGVWATLMQDNMRRLSSSFVAQETRLGWLLFGEVPTNANLVTANIAKDMNQAEGDSHLDQLLRGFFESESLTGDESSWTAEQQACEDHFLKTHKFDSHAGRYILQIPLRSHWGSIGSNRAIALQRFLRLEKRFRRDAELKEKYFTFINEYVAKDWLRPATRPDAGKSYYIPHHAITTKFRVVFDASCLTDTGVSLNDVQMIGPKLQPDLIDLLWGFRLNAYGVSADIKQMFPQVKIANQHWDLQRIFWRDHSGKITEYWLTGVTFGMASAPFCAVRAMQQCARDNASRWPLGARAVLDNFYMDDCLVGADTEEELLLLCQQMQKLLKAGGFELTKFRSNSNYIHRSIATQLAGDDVWLNTHMEASVLGLKWIPSTDEFAFAVQSLPDADSACWTKRSVLNITARIYDPDGLAAPFIINAKILIQKIWKEKQGWDAMLPEPLKVAWQSIFSQIPHFDNLRIPRWIGYSRRLNMTLHGFSDASTQAFGAAVYVVMHAEEGVKSNVLLTKSRVAPLRAETIPRLELRAATLLSELMQRVVMVCETQHRIKIGSMTCWSDSMVVLCWLRRDKSSLKQFVANRVRQININTTNCEWRYVPTEKNPADFISRGMSMVELMSSRLWWQGPVFLRLPSAMWPKPPEGVSEKVETEAKKECRRERIHTEKADNQFVARVSIISIKQMSLLERYSSINRLIRVTAWVLRFAQNCRSPMTERQKLYLSVKELEYSLAFWMRQEQGDYYADDIRTLQHCAQNKKTLEGSKLSNAIGILAPFIQDGILRMNGRLKEADLPDTQCNPAILPGKGRLAWLIARMTHLKLLHCGAQQLIATLRQTYWIIGVRTLARSLIKGCVRCERLRSKMSEQIMANLPACRVCPARPFVHAGIDYAGPIQVRPDRRRGNVVIKGYIAIFVCMVSKAVHLEFVPDLSTKAFIMAFIRFTSRYGHCLHLWSDNGTNFVGAERDLSRMLQTWQKSDLFEQLAARQTEWHFITPSEPHQGGLWEAAVKAAKHHLRRVMGARLLTIEAVQTLLAEFGAILNSRPLCAQSADPRDLNPLTPGHLLIGESLVPALGEQVPVAEWSENRLDYWESRQLITQRFWKLWSNSYLHELQQRPKWREVRRNLKVGDLVVVKNEATPPTLWKMARVTALHPGSDGQVSNVTLWTGSSSINRPVQKLCVLPVEPIEPRAASSLKAGGCCEASEVVGS